MPRLQLSLHPIRYKLFVSLLVLAPLSKYPSIATPLFNFTSFRLGLYQLLMLAFTLTCLVPLIQSYTKLARQHRFAFTSIISFAFTLLLGLVFAVNKARGILLAGSILLLLLTVLAAWWYVAFELQQNKYKSLLRTVLLAGVIYGMFSILQFVLAGFAHQNLGILCKGCSAQIFGFPRINGFAAEPQFHANAMMVYFFLGLGAFYYNRSKLALSACLLSLIAICLTLSRGAYLAVFIGVITFYMLLRMQAKVRVRTIALHISTVVITILVAAGLLVSASAYRYRSTPDIAYKTVRSLLEQTSLGIIKLPEHKNTGGFKPAGLVQASAGERLGAAKLGLKAWRYNAYTLLLGVGGGNLGPFVVSHIDSLAPKNLTVYIQYILVLSETGLIGLIAFLGLIYSSASSILKKAWRHDHASIYTSLFCLILAFAVQFCFFGSYINVPYVWVFLGIGLGVKYGKSRQKAL